MKGRDDFKAALGRPDEDFVNRIHATLSALPEDEEVKVKKVYRTVFLVAALLAVMTYALAESNLFGVISMLSRSTGMEDRAVSAIQEEVQQNIALTGEEHPLLNVRLSETIYDGTNLIAVVEITPKDDKVLLVGEWEYDPTGSLPMTLAREDGSIEDTGLTIAEYAARNGYERIMSGNAMLSLSDGGFTTDNGAENIPGGIRIMEAIQGMDSRETASIQLRVTSLEAPEGKAEAIQRVFTAEIPRKNGGKQTFVSAAPTDFASVGVRVDSITAHKTTVGYHVIIDYTVTDPEAYRKTDDGLWFEYLNEAGERIDMVLGGEVTKLSDTQFRQVETLTLYDEEISSFTVRAYECWEKQRFDTNVIPMQRAE